MGMEEEEYQIGESVMSLILGCGSAISRFRAREARLSFLPLSSVSPFAVRRPIVYVCVLSRWDDDRSAVPIYRTSGMHHPYIQFNSNQSFRLFASRLFVISISSFLFSWWLYSNIVLTSPPPFPSLHIIDQQHPPVYQTQNSRRTTTTTNAIAAHSPRPSPTLPPSSPPRHRTSIAASAVLVLILTMLLLTMHRHP